MKKYLFIIIAALAMVGCENNGVEQNNELVGKTFATDWGNNIRDEIHFNTNTTANFKVEFSDGYKSNKKVFYSFSDTTIIVGYDKNLSELLDTFIYHTKYLDRVHKSSHLFYYLEE